MDLLNWLDIEQYSYKNLPFQKNRPLQNYITSQNLTEEGAIIEKVLIHIRF